MNILEKNKHSIDFINDDGEVRPFRANIYYKKGLIEGLPFLILKHLIL